MTKLVRTYFFLGVVVVTMMTLLASILDLSKSNEMFVMKWTLLGIYSGAILIIIAIANWLGSLQFLNNSEKKWFYIVTTGTSIFAFLLVVSSLYFQVINELNAQVFAELVLKNYALILALPIAVLSVFIYTQKL